MRYCDWDILLFPCGDGAEGANIPSKEFKTQCQTEYSNGRPNEPAPLMSCFIPSLPAGTLFQVSVHSWANTQTLYNTLGPHAHVHYGQQVRELWEVRVVVDGGISAVAHMPIDAKWPQIITDATHDDGYQLQDRVPLRFPAFHPEVLNTPSWQAADFWGRIRVELSAGYHDSTNGGFVRTKSVVTFAFQHAPLDMLQSAGIAWPSPLMYKMSLPREASRPRHAMSNGSKSGDGQISPQDDHKLPSPNNFHPPMHSLPQPSIHGVINPYQNINGLPNGLLNGNAHSIGDGTSRSTSAYSTMSASAGPIFPSPHAAMNTAPQPQNPAQGHPSRDGQFSFRLPSDQLAQIISALNPKKQGSQSQPQSAAESMPPPPRPVNAANFRPAAEISTNGHSTSNHTFNAGHAANGHTLPNGFYAPVRAQRSDLDQNAIDAIDRRAASNSGYSDVSMHPNCDNYPNCITEDPDGCIVHKDMIPVQSMTVVKGKKEGTAGSKPRDFLSVALEGSQTGSSQSQAPSMPTTMAPKDMSLNRLSPQKQGLGPMLVSSSPADATGRKRTRSALKALNINDGGSPQKADNTTDKPVRKSSRASVSSVKSTGHEKENVSDHFLLEHPDGGLENHEMLDA